jgi:prevent-host-death family protein
MSIQMNIAEAKARLSALVEAALRGEDVVLARAGEPVVRIVALEPTGGRRPHVLARLGYQDVDDAAFEPEPAISDAMTRSLFPSGSE